MRPGMTLIAVALLAPGHAAAHATEGGFVLLLPTDLYVAGGGMVVALTVLFLALAPRWRPETLLRPMLTLPRAPGWCPALTQTLALALLVVLLWQGAFGPTDPLRNPLTLGLWTLFWILIVAVQALVFDIWRWVNPFAALARLIGLTGIRPPFANNRPSRWIAVVLFLAFSGFLLADPAPSDPRRLALFAALYVAATALGIALVGPRWLTRAEFLTFLMRTYRQTAIAGPARLGPNGWRILRLGPPTLAGATFMLLLLGSGSFDGLNETFWWLGLLGVNPLEFPGRSAVIAPTLAGLLSVNALLILAYSLSIRAGLGLARSDLAFATAFRVFAPSILPIAAGYHVAHYLTSFLIDGQHLLSLFSTILGAGERHVTTGFLNRLDTVRIVWLAQAGAVVIGHVLAILVAHALALRIFPDPRRATLSQLPLALFMVGYTVFGLWLLATAKGA
ncbi:MAG: hypothetical protein KJO42_02600 [Silicimonas sp.]|nr:hypothetical protein [Silicimonas sp.]